MNEVWKRLVDEATSFEAGLLAIYVGIGYMFGAWISGATWLPGGIVAIDPTGWMFVFAMIAGGLTHLLALRLQRSASGKAEALQAENAEKARVDERLELESRVAATLGRIADDIHAYGDEEVAKPPPAPTPKRGTFDAPVSRSPPPAEAGSAGARRRLRKAAVALRTALELFRDDDLDVVGLEKALTDAKTERRAVREAFSLPVRSGNKDQEPQPGPILGEARSQKAVSEPFSN